jgi:Domain of unknown function (DUF4394)/PEP-CTERM motif
MRRVLLLLTVLVCLAAVSAWAADTGMLFAIDNDNNSLYAINPNTYTATFIGSTGVNAGSFGDLTYNPNTNTAYWVPGRGNDNLYTINLQTGAATLVGAHNVDDMFALGYDTATSTLYGDSSNGNFYSISTTNGAATLIGSNSVYPGGLAYRADTNQMILLGAGSATFNLVNVANGTTSLLGGSGFVNDNGVTWDPAQGKFFVDDYSGNLYTGDPNTWQLTQVGSLPGAFDGIIYVGSVPEPSTIMLLGSGILGLAGTLRRRK